MKPARYGEQTQLFPTWAGLALLREKEAIAPGTNLQKHIALGAYLLHPITNLDALGTINQQANDQQDRTVTPGPPIPNT